MADKKRKGPVDKASRASGRGDLNIKPAGSARKPKTRKPDEANGLPERSLDAATTPPESPPERSPSVVTIPLEGPGSRELAESAVAPRVENPDGPQGIQAAEAAPSSQPIEDTGDEPQDALRDLDFTPSEAVLEEASEAESAAELSKEQAASQAPVRVHERPDVDLVRQFGAHLADGYVNESLSQLEKHVGQDTAAPGANLQGRDEAQPGERVEELLELLGVGGIEVLLQFGIGGLEAATLLDEAESLVDFVHERIKPLGPIETLKEWPFGKPRTLAGRLARGAGNIAVDVPIQYFGGVFDGSEAAGDLALSLTDLPLIGYGDGRLQLVYPENHEEIRSLPEMPEPTTLAGSVVRSVMQYLIFYKTFGRLFKVKNARSYSGRILRELAAGALADAISQDGSERLANALHDAPEIIDPVVEFLKSNEEDSEALDRFKNALEGAIPTLLLTPFALAVRAYKSVRGKDGVKALLDNLARRQADDAVLASFNDFNRPLVALDDLDQKAVNSFLKSGRLPFTGGPAKVNLARVTTPQDVRNAIVETGKAFDARLAINAQDLLQLRDTLPVLGQDLDRLAQALKDGRLSAKQVDALRRNAEGLEQIVKLANETGRTPDDIFGLLVRGDFTVGEIAATRLLLENSSLKIRGVAGAVASGKGTDVQGFVLMRQIAYHAALLDQLNLGRSGAGQRLRDFQIVADTKEGRRRAVQEWLASPAGQSLDVISKAFSSLTSVEQINAFIRAAANAKSPLDVIDAYVGVKVPLSAGDRFLNRSRRFVEAIPPNPIMTAIARDFLSDDSSLSGASPDAQLQGRMATLAEFLVLSWKMRQEGDSGGDQGFVDLGKTADSLARPLGFGRGPWSRVSGLLGVSMAGIASPVSVRLEGFVALLQRSSIRPPAASGLSGSAVLSGEIPNAANSNVREGQSRLPVAGAPESAAQHSFGTGYFAGVQGSQNGALREAYLPGLSSVGSARNETLARIEFGGFLTLLVWNLAAQGRITGGGPADAGLRDELSRSGWQPYSIKVGDDWVPYGQDSLLGGLIAMAVDSHDVIGRLEDVDAQDLFVSLSGSFGQRLGSSAWMDSFSAFVAAGTLDVDAMSSEEQQSLLNELERASQRTPAVQDPVFQQTRSMLGAFQEVAPGYSDALPPSRNIWGEPVLFRGFQNRAAVSPFEIGSRQAAPLDQEVQRLGFEPNMPGETLTVNGVNVTLTPQEHDRLVVLAGNEAKDPESGVGLRDALSALIETEAYKKESDGPSGGRAWLVREVIQQYQALARAQLIAERERLQRALQDEARRLNEAAGQEDAVEPLRQEGHPLFPRQQLLRAL